jgi:hypothetical protein
LKTLDDLNVVSEKRPDGQRLVMIGISFPFQGTPLVRCGEFTNFPHSFAALSITALPQGHLAVSPLSHFSRAFAPFPLEFAALPDIDPRYPLEIARISSRTSFRSARQQRSVISTFAGDIESFVIEFHWSSDRKLPKAGARGQPVASACPRRGREVPRHWII